MNKDVDFVFGFLGKLAIFRSIIIGNPTPTVTWIRNNGELDDPEVYRINFDANSGEHQLQVSRFV